MKEIIKWLKSKKQDYSKGVLLFAKAGKNKNLINYFNHGESETRKAKLVYELSKIAEMPVPEVVPVKTSSNQPTAKMQIVETTRTPFNKLPLIVQEVIKQKGNLFSEREQLHESLKAVPQNNNKANKDSRAIISRKIDHISKRIDELYAAQKVYEENNKLPDESILNWNKLPAKPTPKVMNHKKLSDIELKNRQTNLRGNITKTKNILAYQKPSKQEKKNPLPDGPKRDKYEAKLEKLTFELEAIGKEIKNRS